MPSPKIDNPHPLFVLVGESRVGKSTLSAGLLAIWSDHRNPLTPVRRDASDDRILRACAQGPALIVSTITGARRLNDAFSHVVPVKIEPVNRPQAPPLPVGYAGDEGEYWKVIQNDFGKGGRAQALAAVQKAFMDYLQKTNLSP